MVTVYAASSLTDIMEFVETDFESRYPDVDVRVNVAGTNTLLRQVNNGADVDLFLAADVTAFDLLADPPVEAPSVLAVNTLTLVVPADNPASISAPSDLGADGVLTARCAPGVPCGDATDRFLDASGLSIHRSTDEPNVRSVLAKVAGGEVDAGFVYRSDLASGVEVTEIALADAPTVTVGAARLTDHELSRELMTTLTSDEVRQRFVEMGFAAPESTASASAVSADD